VVVDGCGGCAVSAGKSEGESMGEEAANGEGDQCVREAERELGTARARQKKVENNVFRMR
jgi:hypothetical protein